MKSTQESQIKYNAAWRAFWIKIREMNACAVHRPEKAADIARSESAGKPDGPDSSMSSSKGGGGAKQKSL